MDTKKKTETKEVILIINNGEIQGKFNNREVGDFADVNSCLDDLLTNYYDSNVDEFNEEVQVYKCQEIPIKVQRASATI